MEIDPHPIFFKGDRRPVTFDYMASNSHQQSFDALPGNIAIGRFRVVAKIATSVLCCALFMLAI